MASRWWRTQAAGYRLENRSRMQIFTNHRPFATSELPNRVAAYTFRGGFAEAPI